jgi:uncharacterized protein with PQ loop repeat
MLHHVRKNKKKELIDYFIYWFVFTTPLFELPQAYIIYSQKDSSNVSLPTWGYFGVSSVFWLIFGIHKRIKPIIFAYSMYLLIEIVIAAGILVYG